VNSGALKGYAVPVPHMWLAKISYALEIFFKIILLIPVLAITQRF
jgi:hypothetical protein